MLAPGGYQNASEVLREGLRLVEAREAREAAELKALQEAARVGIADLEEGRNEAFESVDDLADYLHDLSERALPRGRDDP